MGCYVLESDRALTIGYIRRHQGYLLLCMVLIYDFINKHGGCTYNERYRLGERCMRLCMSMYNFMKFK